MVIFYSLLLLAILITLTTTQLSAIGSFLTAFQTVNRVLPMPLSTWLGRLVALGFATSLFASGVTFLIAVSRTHAIAALHRAAPLGLGQFSRRFETPITATILSCIVAVTVVASIGLSAFGSEHIGVLFIQVPDVAILTDLLAYLLMFPSFLILRYKNPAIPHRYRVSGGQVGAWIVTLLPVLHLGIACSFAARPERCLSPEQSPEAADI